MTLLEEYIQRFGAHPPKYMMTSYNDDCYQKLLMKALDRGTPITKRDLGYAYRGVHFDIKPEYILVAEMCFEYFKKLPKGGRYSTSRAVHELGFDYSSSMLWKIDHYVGKLISKSTYKVEYPYGIIGIPYNTGCTKLTNEDGQLFTEEERKEHFRRVNELYNDHLLLEKDVEQLHKLLPIFNLTNSEIASKCHKIFMKMPVGVKTTFQAIAAQAVGFVLDIIYTEDEIESIYLRFLNYLEFHCGYIVRSFDTDIKPSYSKIIWKEVDSDYRKPIDIKKNSKISENTLGF